MAAKNKRISVIMDCDTKCEIDDQFAIVHALCRPDVKVEGVVSVQNPAIYGANSVDIYHREAQKLLRLMGSSVKAYKGSRDPIRNVGEPVRSEGVDFILQKAKELGKNLSIVSTGPATDIANAILLEPQIMKMPRIFFVGGFRDNKEKKAHNNSECNFDNDKLAVKVLMEYGGDFTMIPAWGVTDRMILQIRIFSEELKENGAPICRYLAHLLDSVGNQHRVLWDIAGVCVACNLGVEKILKKPACILDKDMTLTYPARSKRMIKVVDRIDEFAMLSDAKKRILAIRFPV